MRQGKLMRRSSPTPLSLVSFLILVPTADDVDQPCYSYSLEISLFVRSHSPSHWDNATPLLLPNPCTPWSRTRYMYPTLYCVINPQSTQTPRDLTLAQFESLPSTWGRPFDRHEPRGHESIIRSQSVRIGLEINVRTGERHQYLARRAF